MSQQTCVYLSNTPVVPCKDVDDGETDWALCSARLAFRLCDFSRAVSLYELTIARCQVRGAAPCKGGFYAGLGASQAMLGKLEPAVASYMKAVELSPEEDGLWTALGNTLARAGKHEQACAAYRRALEIFPDSPRPAHGVHVLQCADP